MGDHTGLVFPDAAAELVGTLADEGVEHLFINPGTDTAPVQEALAAARANGTPHPRSVLCTHEFVALSAAMGHHLAGGGPQAVMVHVDAGTLNLGGAIANAQRNHVPVVIFAGRTPYSIAPEVPGHRDTYIHWQQEQSDQQAILRAFGKWTMEVPRGRELGGIVRRAYQVARSDPAGPAYVMLPRESLMEPGGAELSRRLNPPRPAAPDPGGLADMARALAHARRPVVVTGRTGARPDAVAALVELAELIGSPVIDHQDRLNFPPRHPLFAGGEVDGADELRAADVVLVLDAEVPWIPVQAAPPPDAIVLQIDVDCVKHTMPMWAYPIELALTASTALALPLLTAELRGLAPLAGAARRGRRTAGQKAHRVGRSRGGPGAGRDAAGARQGAAAGGSRPGGGGDEPRGLHPATRPRPRAPFRDRLPRPRLGRGGRAGRQAGPPGRPGGLGRRRRRVQLRRAYRRHLVRPEGERPVHRGDLE